MKDDLQRSASADSIITLESEVAEWPKYGNAKPCPTCNTVVESPGEVLTWKGCGPGDFVEIREDTPLGVVLWMRALHYVQVVVLYPISVLLTIAFMVFMSICIIGGLGEYTLKAFFRITIEATAAPLLPFLFLAWCLVLPVFMAVAWLLQCLQRLTSVQSHQEAGYYEHKVASM
ncbi:hypothetical protein Poli38472_002474 [Pythium oligandrum]|uniref:Uncharacterized protein n=1 Tax=Pythium oligandrum TaxID=41045 RepID=A0A8K1CJF1_PYTOL|nr:hypothetical protein Poli38472_002474 [Pythium oligandrum]|eukprot:TMW63533.1 hypothetical protein Poli38472_002474 [Pythium oligandrum]